MSQTDPLEVRYGYDEAWLDRAIEIYNETEMKKDNREKVGRTPYLEWERNPLEVK